MRKPSIVVSMFCIVACHDTKPARIESPQNVAINDRKETPAGAFLVNQAGEPVEGNLSYSATPSSVMSVSSDGRLKCLTSGDASLVIAGAGQSATSTVKCRIVAAITGPKEARLILGRAPEVPALSATDDAGRPLSDVALDLASSNPSVVRVEAGQMKPIQVGRVEMKASAGIAVFSFPVTVVELINSSPLVLNDGESKTFTLQQGNYDLDVVVKAADGSRYGVTVKWVGATCEDAAESQEHHLRCSVAQTASLTIANPTTLGLGPAEQGFVNLYRGK